jgi:tetraacyldisaccharide 4'-kinase
MIALRLFLLPLSLIYWCITAIRNFCFDKGIFKSYTIPVKSILVGNLSTGGTGKTPLVDYILAHFKTEYNVASLSRGYGRKTKGIVVADSNATSKTIGDEPLQYYQRHKDDITVVVSEKREVGVKHLLNTKPETDLIVLDDAFQHRAVTAGLKILITPYNSLYSDDYLLPAGNLRESKVNAKRADILFVSKVPNDLSEKSKLKIKKKLNFHNDNVFFSSIQYGAFTPIGTAKPINTKNVLVVTGIGNPQPLLDHLSDQFQVTHMNFSDHHDFNASDIAKIHEKFDTFASRDKIIVTTEKDFMRLKEFEAVFDENYPWTYQPITVDIDREKEFNTLLETYVRKV